MTLKKLVFKIGLFLISVFLAVFFSSQIAQAHPGNTASDGCHYCRTNCDSWGETWNVRHCHGGSSFSIPTTPTCPLFARYNSLSGQCECNYGYISSGGSCVSRDQYCRNQLGTFGQYDSLSDSCSCSYGYIYVNGRCQDDDSYCRDRFGFNSSYDSLDDSCECDYGYVVDSSGSECISEDDACEEQFGTRAKSNYSGKCECEYGYHFEGNQCVVDDFDLPSDRTDYNFLFGDSTTEEPDDENFTTPTVVAKPSPIKASESIQGPNPEQSLSPSIQQPKDSSYEQKPGLIRNFFAQIGRRVLSFFGMK